MLHFAALASPPPLARIFCSEDKKMTIGIIRPYVFKHKEHKVFHEEH